MTKKLFYFATLILLMSSCAANREIVNADDNMRLITVGMNKNNVILIMGKNYKNSAAERIDEKTLLETITYLNSYGEEYELTFKNNELTKWDRVKNFREHYIKKEIIKKDE